MTSKLLCVDTILAQSTVSGDEVGLTQPISLVRTVTGKTGLRTK